MAWTDGDLKILAVGMAIGGQWNQTGQSMLPPPTGDPPPGNYFGTSQIVALSAQTEGAIIRFTVDGQDVGADGAIYTGPLLIERDTVIKAFAAKGWKTSPQAALKYVVKNPLGELADDILEAEAWGVLEDEVEISFGTQAVEAADELWQDAVFSSIEDAVETANIL